jgi:hypothetical protein
MNRSASATNIVRTRQNSSKTRQNQNQVHEITTETIGRHFPSDHLGQAKTPLPPPGEDQKGEHIALAARRQGFFTYYRASDFGRLHHPR